MGLLTRMVSAAAALFPERDETPSLKIHFPSGSGGQGSANQSFFSDDALNLSRLVNLRSSSVDYSSLDAMLSSIVMSCVNSVTRVFPEARLRAMQRVGKETKEIEGHDGAVLIGQPNPFMSTDEFWQVTNVDYDIRGNAYWWKIRDKSRAVVELFPLSAMLMRARWPRDGSEFISYYELWTGKEWSRIETEDIVHFRNGLDVGSGSDGRYGLSPLKSVRRDMYADEEGGNYTSAILRNAGVVGAVFSPKAQLFTADSTFPGLTDDDKKAMAASYQEAYGGDNRGRPLVFEVPMDISKIAFSPADMTLDTIHRKAEARISGLLNVPAIIAGLQVGLEQSTYSNTEQAMKALWTNNIAPRQRAMAGKLTAQLMPDFGPDGAFFAFDTSQVEALQESNDSRDARAAKLFVSKVITRNQALVRIGEVPLTGPEGDEYYTGTVGQAPQDALPPAKGTKALGAPMLGDLDDIAEQMWQAGASRPLRNLLLASVSDENSDGN